MSKVKVLAAAAVLAVAGLLVWWAAAGTGSPGPGPVPDPAAEPVVAARGDETGAPPATAGERTAIAPVPASAPRAPVNRGRAVDPGGRPLPGVPLVLAGSLPEAAAPRPDPVTGAPPAARAEPFEPAALPPAGATNEEGAFAVAASRPRHLFAGPGWATLRTPMVGPEGGTGLVLVAAPAVAVRGTVLDDAGRPLAGVQVEVRMPPLGELDAVLDRTRENSHPPAWSAPDGTFAVEHLPQGRGELTFRKAGHVSTRVAVPAADRAGERVVLPAIAREHLVLHGRVLDTAERAIAGALVGLHGRSAHTHADGTFQLVFHRREDAPPGFASLFAAHPGYQTAVLPDFGARLTDPAQREVVVRLTGPTLEIAGRVLDAAGEPRRDVLVYLHAEPSVVAERTAEELAMRPEAPVEKLGPGIRVWSRTDAQGRFQLGGLRAQDYRLRVLQRRPLAAFTSAPVAAGSRGVEVRLPPSLVHERVAGTVVAADGAPVAGVQLTAQLELYRNGPSRWTDEGPSTVTDAQGRFELRDVPLVDGELAYRGDGIVPGHADVPAQPGGLRIVVERRCHFRVEVGAAHGARRFRVLDANGTSLLILQIGTDGYSSSKHWRLEQGRSGVLSASERAVTVVLLGERDAELARLPLRLVPGEITVVRY